MKKIKVGLIIDEFFGGAGTAYGGYGFLARRLIAKYIPNDLIQIDVLLGRSNKNRYFAEKIKVDDVNVYKLPKRKLFSKLWLKKQNYDVYLSIELTYDWVLKHELDINKKLILWIQDQLTSGMKLIQLSFFLKHLIIIKIFMILFILCINKIE